MNSIRFVSLQFLILISLFLFHSCETTEKTEVPEFESCFDNVLNQGELAIDCGGPCDPCPSKIFTKIDGVNWESGGEVNTIKNGNSILMLSGNGTSTLSLIYTGDFTEGTFNLESASYGISATGTNYIANSGVITFFSWNLSEMQVFGTFSFDAYETSGTGDTLHFREGQFWFVPFQQ